MAVTLFAFVLSVLIPGDRITVRAEAGLDKQAAEVAAWAPADLRRIESSLEGLPTTGHVEVRLVRHAEDIAGAAPAGLGAPDWAVGAAYPEAGGGVVVVALRGKDGDVLDVRRTLDHELAHIALDRAVGGENVPRWLTEGFAYLHSSDFSLARGTTLTTAVIANHVEPLWRLETAFPAREDEAALAYAESYDFVAWMVDRDPAGFRRFLDVLAHHGGLDAAARDGFSRRFVDLEGEWVDSLRGRYLWTFVGVGGALVWVFAAMLLVVGYWQRRRAAKKTLARWAVEEAHAEDHAEDHQADN